MTVNYSDLVDRPETLRLRELGDDLAAVWSSAGETIDGWMTRPSILRRVASELAARVGADTDRIVAVGPGSLVLGGAVSLATGLPFCAALDDGTVFGGFHQDESVVAVSVDGTHADPDWLANLHISGRLSVVPGGDQQDGAEALIKQFPLRRDLPALRTKEIPMTDTTRTALVDSLAIEEDGTQSLELALNPAAVTVLGSQMAAEARGYEPSLVMSWAGDDIVLAHTVASALGVPRAAVSLDLGLITVDPPLAPATRAVLVASQFTNENSVASIATMLSERHHTLVLAAALSGEAATGDVPFIALS